MIGHIWRKELKEVLRDRKTMIFIVLFPTVILPTLILVTGLMGYQMLSAKQAEVLQFSVAGPEPWKTDVVKALNALVDTEFIEEESGDLQQLVSQGRLDFALHLHPGFDPVQTNQSRWQLYVDQTDDHGQFARIQQQLTVLSGNWLTLYLNQHGIEREVQQRIFNPLLVEKVGVAAQRQHVGSRVGSVLPYLLLFLCMMGAMLPALDIGAGEKERGTLETLLMVPQPRTTLVVGKFLVIATTSMLLALLTLASSFIWLLVVGSVLNLSLFLTLAAMISPLDIALLLLLLLPIAGVFAAILLAVSIFASSYKEGQNYMGALQIAVIIPAMIAMMPGAKLDATNAWYPLFNVSLAIKELLKGTINYGDLSYVFASNLILASLLLWCCARWFSRETVLFR